MKLTALLTRICSQAVRRLPTKIQTAMAVHYFGFQLKRNKLVSVEPEWRNLERFVSEGDVVLDVGANIGRYTFRLAKLVGDAGLVISVEPISRIFYMLVTLAYRFDYKNIVFLNVALSNQCGLTTIQEDWKYSDNFVFCTNTGSKLNQAAKQANKLVLTLDDNLLDRRISLIKIDVEGHEHEVCLGLMKYIKRDWPVVIVENNDPVVINMFHNLGYEKELQVERSRNLVFVPPSLKC
jgi:FkbM family methyltransferase